MILFEENHLFFALKLFHVKQFFCGHCLFIQLKKCLRFRRSTEKLLNRVLESKWHGVFLAMILCLRL